MPLTLTPLGDTTRTTSPAPTPCNWLPKYAELQNACFIHSLSSTPCVLLYFPCGFYFYKINQVVLRRVVMVWFKWWLANNLLFLDTQGDQSLWRILFSRNQEIKTTVGQPEGLFKLRQLWSAPSEFDDRYADQMLVCLQIYFLPLLMPCCVWQASLSSGYLVNSSSGKNNRQLKSSSRGKARVFLPLFLSFLWASGSNHISLITPAAILLMAQTLQGSLYHGSGSSQMIPGSPAESPASGMVVAFCFTNP